VLKPAPLPSVGALLGGFNLDGVLLALRCRTTAELATMMAEDKRNTLITELSARTRIPETFFFQRYDNDALVAKGAVFLLLREAGIRDDAQLRTMTVDDQRNTLIVENAGRTQLTGSALQGMTDRELVQVGLSWFDKRPS